jgi:hypothetical protein
MVRRAEPEQAKQPVPNSPDRVIRRRLAGRRDVSFAPLSQNIGEGEGGGGAESLDDDRPPLELPQVAAPQLTQWHRPVT